MAQSEWDLAHAREDLERGYYEWACFSAQQAAEKAVKAVLQRWGGEPWGHSITQLLGAVRARETVADDLVVAAQELDKAYVAPRYPNAHQTGTPHEQYNLIEAERLIAYASRILRFCKGLLA